MARTSSICIANGHEIGCHTFSHTRACDLDAKALDAEIAQNRRYLRALDPSIKVENFAYPFGYGSFGRKGQLKQAFQSCRSIVPGINSDTVDLAVPARDAPDRPSHRPRRHRAGLRRGANL